MKRKFISRRSASRKAMKARNDCMEEMRRDSSPLGLLLARIRKREGKSLEQLLDRYSARRYHVPFEKLDKHEKDFASAMLVEGSGRSDIVANRVVACYPFLCSFAVFFAIVASIHTVNKSPDVLKELVHQICSWGLGFAGNKLGDRAGRAVNIGPLIVVICVVIGGYVGANIGNGVVLQWADDDDLTVIV
ncbi:hypothetical protein BD410DRAFT_783834 [Rickenella mellea]|uniref:Uncharacterized protein n=1 Tax=Rickenella mellea TaxID=50990 RepID=A0A4Y7QHZ5_9AGAM|nr:hypothetical protein BD410DRAFT_783834 [Rickenella mellea]